MNKIVKIAIFTAFPVALAVLTAISASAEEANQTIKAKDDAARLKYQEAWGQYQKEVNFFKTAREDFQTARAKLQKAKTTANAKDLEEKTKSFLGKTASSLTKKLEALKNWVSNKRALPEADRSAISAEIDKDIQWLKDKAAGLAGATPEQIKNTAKEIRQYWRTHRIKMKKITGLILAARVNFVIGKAEDFADKVSAKIEELKTAGKDTAQLEAWLIEFRSRIVSAKEKYEAAKAKFSEIKAEAGSDFDNELKAADELFKAGNQFVKEANQYIKDAYAKLRQIVNEMKKVGGAAETSAE